MTVAIGIIASDGIVVAADTQETTPGYWKNYQGKVAAASTMQIGPPMHSAGYIISGAGNSGYLRALSQEFRSILEPPATLDDVEARIRSIVRQFHLEHVAPFQADVPVVDMLIGVQCNGEQALWSTEKSTVGAHGSFGTIGIGGAYAKSLLGTLWRADALDVLGTVALAVYVISRTKDFVDGCGKFTDVLYLRNNDVNVVSQLAISMMEKIFYEYLTATEPGLLRYTFGGAEPPEKIPNTIQVMRDNITYLTSKKPESEP